MRRWTPLICLVGLACSLQAHGQEGGGPATATFSMYCYWTGEATLGRVPGVVRSRIGHQAGQEVVQVDYDPGETDLATLVQALKRHNSFYSVFVTSRAARQRAEAYLDPGEIRLTGHQPRFIASKHSLRTRHPELYALDLTEAQAMALNSWSYFGGPMPDVLTEPQKRRLARTGQ